MVINIVQSIMLNSSIIITSVFLTTEVSTVPFSSEVLPSISRLRMCVCMVVPLMSDATTPPVGSSLLTTRLDYRKYCTMPPIRKDLPQPAAPTNAASS